MTKIILGRFVSYLITLLIGFFVARHMLSADVAQKLYAGDTVELWGGSWTVSLKQIQDFILISIVPTLVPIGLAIWGRIKAQYALILARLSGAKMTNTQVQETVAGAPISTIIQTVVAKP